MALLLAALWLAAMSFAMGFIVADLWRDHQERKRRTPVPAVKRGTWEDEGEEWKEGAPDYTLPPSLPVGVSACPKCRFMNEARRKQGLEPLPGYVHLRRSDNALWCRNHDEWIGGNFGRFISHIRIIAEYDR